MRKRTQPGVGDVAKSVRADVRKGTSKLRFGSRLAASPSSLAAAETVCTGSLVAYDLMGVQDKKLPRPGPIVAATGFYALLGLAAAASDMFAPAVVAAGWVLALAVLVTGKRGQGMVRLLGDLAKLAAKTGQASTSTATG